MGSSEDVVRAWLEEYANTYHESDFEFVDLSDSAGVFLLADHLFDVAKFGDVVSVAAEFPARDMEEYDVIDAIRRIYDAKPEIYWREHWKACRNDGALKGQASDSHDQLFTVGCGRRRGICYCVFFPEFRVPSDDKQYRKELFERAIESIGLAEKVSVNLDSNDVLRMSAAEPWQLSFPSAEPGRINPLGFNLHGFPNADSASHAWQTIVRHIGAHVTTGMIRADIYMPIYNQIYPRLNQAARGWKMEICASMDGPAALPIEEHGFVERGPGRYPAFEWFDREFNSSVFGTIIVKNTDCFLELAMENGSAVLLRKRAADLEGVEFETILT